MKYILVLAILFPGFFINAQRMQPPTARSTANYNKTIEQVKPGIQAYVRDAARALSGRRFNADSLRQTLKTTGVPGSSSLSQSDVSTLMLLVMQATEAEQYRQLKDLQADMEKNNQEKKALRKEEESITGNRQTVDSSKKIVVKSYPADVSKRLVFIQKEKDRIDDLEQDQMLLLQQMMEKKAQLETMISNMLNAQDDSSEISNNLKAS